MKPIPVIIISGFLGSGKTTLLIRLIAEAHKKGLRPGILMNELGKQDVDGNILQEGMPDLRMEKLFDGCICCDKKGEVTSSLLKLLAQKPDVILIELTGVANPEEIADSLTEPPIKDKTTLSHIVTVLDAEYVLEYNSIFSADRVLVNTLRRQMEVAGLILINKTDLVSETKLDKIVKSVTKSNASAQLHFTRYSEMDLSLILGGLKPIPYEERDVPATSRFNVFNHSTHGRDGHIHTENSRSYSRLVTMELPYNPEKPLTAKQIERFMKQMKGTLLRAKGYVTLSNEWKRCLFQYAGNRFNWSPASFGGPEYIVLIGIDLDGPSIGKLWEDYT